jgi:LEA14-like dessication related protein
MKLYKIFLLITVLTLMSITSVHAQSMARVELEQDTVEVGAIGPYVRNVSLEIPVRNSGNTPLTIYKIKTDCICTTTSFERTPIPPGETRVVKVDIKMERFFVGENIKSIMLYTNGQELQKQIYFTFTVKEK